ncbi:MULTISPECIES: HD-GYP domain-containing protein [unclassified Fusibacter]|uniref:HD-GYP domain-containing protein n=1 Tax=unclassified Fusibacter TaxID=2624464 RepID=UPI0010113805|nr:MULTISPECIES: HD domain-containing phosphohydrolase [unclassified Fusibacter]MCK8058035.1 HD domain-containing protein [Fusibacter sp. A2]NPE20617.1 HD domain-containing protein [Fusibacter sp. A1]RXV62824.1 HD domain-containing protein [Fusibacter sp. A1]
MNGFLTYKECESIQTFDNLAGTFKLLVQDDNIEIFESNIHAGKSILCQPYESKDALNVIIVQEGTLFHTNERKVITSGQRITFKNLTETHHLSVITPTKLLMIRESKFFTQQASTTNEIYHFIHQIQAKDHYSEYHCNAVGNLAVQIATMMRLSDKEIHNVGHAAKVHDIGKVNIPDVILNKPSRLTDQEFEIMRKHPQDGHDLILKTIDSKEIASIVLQHHERLDGSGYPNRLKDDQIRIEAKIIAVVDSFDAMVSKRPYKSPMSPSDALDDLSRHIGIWYEEEIVHTLKEILEINRSIIKSQSQSRFEVK